MEATSAARPHALRIPRPRRLLSALSDERLVDHIRKGETAAFEVLYDRYSSGILGFCRHMLGNASDAEDAAQHAFIAAHADILRHERRDLHVKAWLYTIARNRCLSMLRARREQPSDDGVELSTDNLLHDIEHREDLRALLGDVTKLPDDQREALVLSEVGDLSHGEISEIIGCEVSKVKSLVFQARTALIDRRIARETPCAEIREQLATLRGGALRRSHLRHHLEACPGCTEYREEIKRQRAMLAVALPVVPSLALKAKVFGGIGGGLGLGGSAAAGGGAAVATSSTGFSFAGGGALAKLGVVAALAAGGAGTATIASHGNLPLIDHNTKPAPAATTQSHGSNASAPGTRTARTAAETQAAIARKHKTDGSRRSTSGTAHGFTPVTGESNGARARAFAQTRGKGKEISAAHRHATAHKRAHPVKKVKVKHVAAPPQAPPARTAPVHTTPAPKSTEPTSTAPSTTTQPAPAPSGDTTGAAGGKGGKSLGSGSLGSKTTG